MNTALKEFLFLVLGFALIVIASKIVNNIIKLYFTRSTERSKSSSNFPIQKALFYLFIGFVTLTGGINLILVMLEKLLLYFIGAEVKIGFDNQISNLFLYFIFSLSYIIILYIYYNRREDKPNPVEDQRKLVIRKLVQLLEVMTNMLLGKDGKTLLDFSAELAAMNFDNILDKSFFEKARKILMESAKINNGIQRGRMIGQASEILGDILNHFKITNEELENEGGKELVKKMHSLRKLMLMTNKWRI